MTTSFSVPPILTDPGIHIHFVIGDRVHAYRFLAQVPVPGDRVVLGDGAYIVLKREWYLPQGGVEPQVYLFVRLEG